eukprot:CAMPEP_0179131438 /NCGR_PEP_ID=MMETSP0796-20121207/62439_1 /TAXON_ID=73915 /ORGANISM="Pyrodinium bahamense, Strain pbaha01" /LENGTH=347 /DNA_ID=CAMNT_0020830367 /DNA_START=182 /DNA_END=1222 /DNA_ORIENTATION=-
MPAAAAPVVLGQLSSRTAGLASRLELESDSHASVMVICLLGVPLITACLAFFIIEVTMNKGDMGDTLQMHRQNPRLTVGSAATPRTSVQSVYTDGGYVAHQHPTSHNLQTGAFLQRPCNGGMESLASLPLIFPSSSVGAAAEVLQHTAAPPTASSLAEDECNASPLSTALIVKSPAGTFVRLDGQLLPHHESRTLNVVSAKDGEVILCAHVSENSVVSTIHVETKAKNIPIAVLDTSQAVYQRSAPRPPLEGRRVVLHRVIGEDRGATGPPCAWVGPMAGGAFLVHYMCPQDNGGGATGDVAFTVHTKQAPGGSSPFVECMLDGQGQVVSKSETIRYGQKALWVRQG